MSDNSLKIKDLADILNRVGLNNDGKSIDLTQMNIPQVNTPTVANTLTYQAALNTFMSSLYESIVKDVKSEVIRELKIWVSRVFTYQFNFKDIKFDNLSEEQNNYIEEFNFKNNMIANHLLCSRLKASEGKIAISLRIGNRLLPEVLEVIGTPKYFNGELKEFYGTKNYITQKEEQHEITWYRFVKLNKQVIVETYISPFTNDFKNSPLVQKEEKQNTYTYKNINYIPVMIFKQNESSEAEWEYVANSINFNAHFSNEMIKEWNYIRTQLLNNMNQNPDKTGKQMQDAIEGGKERVHDVYDPDGALQQALSYFSNGGITTDIARGIIMHFKDEIKENIFMLSRVQGGNNKHTSEAMSDNINAFNYISARQYLISVEMAKFYYLVLDMSNKYGYASIGALPNYLKGIIQLARPLEVLMNLNADSKEIDGQQTTKFIQETDEGDK